MSPQFASLYDDQVFMWSDCSLNLGTDFLVGSMVFAHDHVFRAHMGVELLATLLFQVGFLLCASVS